MESESLNSVDSCQVFFAALVLTYSTAERLDCPAQKRISRQTYDPHRSTYLTAGTPLGPPERGGYESAEQRKHGSSENDASNARTPRRNMKDSGGKHGTTCSFTIRDHINHTCVAHQPLDHVPWVKTFCPFVRQPLKLISHFFVS